MTDHGTGMQPNATDPTTDLSYVDDRELARRTPIRLITWQTWRRHRAGPPFYKIGRRCIYRWAEVVTWLEAQRGGGAARVGNAP